MPHATSAPIALNNASDKIARKEYGKLVYTDMAKGLKPTEQLIEAVLTEGCGIKPEGYLKIFGNGVKYLKPKRFFY
jgi:hypothetical protein